MGDCLNKSRFEEAASELGVAKLEETEEKTKIKKLMEEKGLLLVELVNGPAQPISSQPIKVMSQNGSSKYDPYLFGRAFS